MPRTDFNRQCIQRGKIIILAYSPSAGLPHSMHIMASKFHIMITKQLQRLLNIPLKYIPIYYSLVCFVFIRVCISRISLSDCCCISTCSTKRQKIILLNFWLNRIKTFNTFCPVLTHNNFFSMVAYLNSGLVS